MFGNHPAQTAQMPDPAASIDRAGMKMLLHNVPSHRDMLRPMCRLAAIQIGRDHSRAPWHQAIETVRSALCTKAAWHRGRLAGASRMASAANAVV